MSDINRPIGIFDSGIGGLSVLRHIREQLPHENLLYFADSGFAPYGDKPEEVVIRRTLDIAHYLLTYHCKALVVACNTATAAAIHLLRTEYPDMPIVGIEPGLKPAAAITKNRVVGVLATERTLKSKKFSLLHQQLEQTGVKFIPQAGHGLVDKVEKNELDSTETVSLVNRYLQSFFDQNADTIVLGCTHYPFLQPVIEAAIQKMGKENINIIDTGTAVARQLVRLLDQSGLKQTGSTPETGIHAQTTGDAELLSNLFKQLLNIDPDVSHVTIEMIASPSVSLTRPV